LRRKRNRIDEQLELLRATIPDLYTDEKESILASAYEYIENLQRQVQELNDEVDGESAYSDDDEDEEDNVSSCEDDLSAEVEQHVDSNAGLKLDRAEYCGCSNPTVGGLKREVDAVKKQLKGAQVAYVRLQDEVSLRAEKEEKGLAAEVKSTGGSPKAPEAPIEESAANKETSRSEEEHRSVSNDIEENLSSTWDIEMAITEDQQSESIFEETVGSDRVGAGCREAAKSFKKKIGPAVLIIKSAAEADEALKKEDPIVVAYLESVEVEEKSIKKKIGPAVLIIKSAAEADEALKKEDPIVVAYLESVEVEEKSIEANVGIPSESAKNDDVSPEIPAAGPSDSVDSKGLEPEVVHEVVEPFLVPAPFDVEEKSAEVSSEDIGEVHMVANLVV
jgi:hypothetical protein